MLTKHLCDETDQERCDQVNSLGQYVKWQLDCVERKPVATRSARDKAFICIALIFIEYHNMPGPYYFKFIVLNLIIVL